MRQARPRTLSTPLTRTLILTALLSGVQGCVPVLLVPWPAETPRFTEEQLTSLVPGTSTRDSIARTLGSPSESQDFVRSEGRYWIYTWTRKGFGRLFRQEDAQTAIRETAFALFLTFDESGVLASRQLTEQGISAKPTRMCSSDGVCIAHLVVTPDLTDRGFHDPSSALTFTQQNNSWEPPIDQCRVVLWLDGSTWADAQVNGIQADGIDIDVGPEGVVTSWLPVDAYVVLNESPGEQVIRFHNPWFEGYAGARRHNFAVLLSHFGPQPQPITQDMPFKCEAGRIYYVSVGAGSKDLREKFGLVWRQIPAEDARERLQGMSELVLPDGVRYVDGSLLPGLSP